MNSLEPGHLIALLQFSDVLLRNAAKVLLVSANLIEKVCVLFQKSNELHIMTDND